MENKFDGLSENDPIKKALLKAIKEIKENPFSGRIVKKKLIPKKFIIYKNLMIYNLPSAWRMLYTVSAEGEVDILSIILDWMNHKDYEDVFGF